MTTSDKPNIVVVGTGGTIAGSGRQSTDTAAYQCSVRPIEAVVAEVPELAACAQVRTEQLFQTGSENMDSARLLMLGKHVAALLEQPEVDGVVVTQGTDTIEETAYFLHLTLKSDKPVVVAGAMRPPSALSNDVALNLYNAVAVAASTEASGKGVLVVLNEEIHTARDVLKTSSFQLDAFRSPYGPLGYVVEGQPRFYRHPARPHTTATEWDIGTLETLPQVSMVVAHGGITAASVAAAIGPDTAALIYAGTGNGNVAEAVLPVLLAASEQGVRVVRASRTGEGVVIRNGAQPDDRYGWLVVDDQPPQKARLLMALALTGTTDPAALQAIFHRY